MIPALKEDASFRVTFPKKTSGIASDLTGMSGNRWGVADGCPWQPVAAASIDDIWTGTRSKLAPNLESERQNRAAEEIRDLDGTLVVDRVNRVIHLPKGTCCSPLKAPRSKSIFRQSFVYQ